MTFEQLVSASHWDFSKIPDKELFTCLIWEYGRESIALVDARLVANLRDKTEPFRYDHKLKERVQRSKIERRRAFRTLKDLELDGFDLEAFLEQFWMSDYAYNEWYRCVRLYGGWGSRPWQEFEPDTKDAAVRSLHNDAMICPIENASVGDLERLWDHASKELQRVRQTPNLRNESDAEDCALCERVLPVRYNDPDDAEERKITASLTIDFKRYSDKAIIGAFAIWLKQVRPKDWLEQTKRGKKLNDQRVALEALGIMRVLHEIRFRDPRFPNIYKRFGEAHCYKARKLALRHFRKIFPFLPESEKPASWATGKGQFILP